MTARLQADTTSGKPVLLRVDYDAGHGMGSTKSQRDDELADELAFLLWQLGLPSYQPARRRNSSLVGGLPAQAPGRPGFRKARAWPGIASGCGDFGAGAIAGSQ